VSLTTHPLFLEHTALLVIDMQRDFCALGGYADQAGMGVSRLRAPIPAIQALLDRARGLAWACWWCTPVKAIDRIFPTCPSPNAAAPRPPALPSAALAPSAACWCAANSAMT